MLVKQKTAVSGGCGQTDSTSKQMVAGCYMLDPSPHLSGFDGLKAVLYAPLRCIFGLSDHPIGSGTAIKLPIPRYESRDPLSEQTLYLIMGFLLW